MHDKAIAGIDQPAVSVTQGGSALVLGVPHGGTFLPDPVLSALNDTGRGLSDTDWHMARLYADLLPGVTIVAANFHRYLIDANRDPSGESLYPGQNTTGLVPMTDFDGEPIWTTPPDADEVEARRAGYHAPYHAALAAELARVRARHGVAILYDCHSIRSHVPFLFDGRLPDFNIGTNGTTTCAAQIEAAVSAICTKADGYSTVCNGRFKGGWTTRHYGQPARGIHAIQMELAQITHLASETPPFAYDPDRAGRLRPILREILQTLETLAPTLRGQP
ncbi:MAG: N-formylglutamate deformylase [Rhodobacteraceae bacterium]|nr:N-formylglutamate deformylase [Paracoccaceae bacterium]